MEESLVIQAVRQKVQEWIDANDNTKDLDLSRMNITELPADIFAGCSKLKRIYLNYNRLAELPADIFAGCSKLQSIYLSYNQLTELPADLFVGCSQLESIWLRHNQLTKLPADLFAGCSKLRIIELNNNQLIELPVSLFAGCSRLKYINFDKPLIYGILWSLPDLDKPEYDYSRKLVDEFPFECAHVKKYRRISINPSSYGWDVRKYAILCDPSDLIWYKRAHAVVVVALLTGY
jgi:hypothetical protein